MTDIRHKRCIIILSNCPNKQCDSYPIPTWLLKECSSVLVPTITNIVNLSLISGQFHPTLKESVISPLLKKPTLDKEELSSYRPILNLSLISKIIECVVKSRLMDHLTSNSLLNSHQSAYCKHHSTETALLYIHDYFISAMDHRKYHASAYSTSLLLSTLLTMTSWSPASHPGLVSVALFSVDWSHICHLVFCVKCETNLSSWYTSSCGVPQGSVLGPLLFLMYTTPVSTLMSSCSLNHHLYADDSTFPFLPSNSLWFQYR